MQKLRPKELGLLFVVGGPGGSGASTISKMLAKHFKLKRTYAGQIFRNLVKNYGFEELNDLYSELPIEDIYEFDRVTDDQMIRESQEKDVLIESKNFAGVSTNKGIPCTVKIWLESSLDVRTKRHLKRDGYDKFPGNILKYIQIRRFLRERYESDKKRYKVLYNMDYDNPELYNDIVIDSSKQTVNETYNLILKKIKDGGYIK